MNVMSLRNKRSRFETSEILPIANEPDEVEKQLVEVHDFRKKALAIDFSICAKKKL
jgi:hypothetical protein